jgi:hypothetical protein
MADTTDIIIVPLTEEEEAEHLEYVAQQKIIDEQRKSELKRYAYQTEADPLFFKWQRGETGFTEKVWKSKIAEIDARFNKEPESITLEGEK